MTCPKCAGLLILNHDEVRCLLCAWRPPIPVYQSPERVQCRYSTHCRNPPMKGFTICVIHSLKMKRMKKKARTRRADSHV